MSLMGMSSGAAPRCSLLSRSAMASNQRASSTICSPSELEMFSAASSQESSGGQ